MLLRETWHIRHTETVRDIREELEQKRVEYEERLERVEDEQRSARLKDELEALDQALSQLSGDPEAFMEQMKRERTAVLKKPSFGTQEEPKQHQPVRESGESRLCERAEGLLGTPDYEDGIELYKQLAKAGNLRAMLRLSALYDLGHRIYRDREKALSWMEKVYAAVGYEPERLLALGDACFRGNGVNQDSWQAHLLYLEADKREAGLNPEQMVTVGMNYQYGNYGFEKSTELALQWYERAGAAGGAAGYKRAGDINYFGEEDFPRNRMRSAQLYKKAVELGDIESLYDLGMAYFCGHGVPLNEKKGFDYLQEAAEKGICWAQNVVGECYDVGKSWLPQDYVRAAFWYKKAVNPSEHDGRVSHLAETNLGLLYDKGAGVPQNFRQAAALFLKAAESGDKDGAAKLGCYYDMGRGVERDMEKANHYMQIAADQGHTGAAGWLKQHKR